MCNRERQTTGAFHRSEGFMPARAIRAIRDSSLVLAPGLGRALLLLVLVGVAGAQQLSGKWKDSNGDLITIVHSGRNVIATPDSARVRRWWNRGDGVVNGDRIRMDHKLNGVSKDVQTGTVTSGRRIDWGNGSHWIKQSPPPRPAASTLALRGTWVDSNGDTIRIHQAGEKLTATPLSARVKKYWTIGEGRLSGSRVRMVHKLNGVVKDVQEGNASADGRITWGNGSTWRRTAAARRSDRRPTHRGPPPPPVVVDPPAPREPEPPVSLFPETYTVPRTMKEGATKYPVKLTFFNEAGYVARFKLTYYANGRVHRFKTGSMAFKERQQHVMVPQTARNIYVTAEYWSAGWNRVFRRRVNLEDRRKVFVNGKRVLDPSNHHTKLGFKTYGTVFDPQWNNNVEPWVPVFSGAVHVANKSGKPIYVGYCTDLAWSAANGAGGIMMALIDDVRNGKRNAVKYLAIAMAAGIKVPEDLVRVFREVGVEVRHQDAKLVCETSVVDSIEALFSAATGPLSTALVTLAQNVANDPELARKNVEMNPIIATAGVFGARTLNLVVFNADMSRYWLIPTGTDESWIIEKDRVYLAKRGTLRTRASNGRSYPGVPTGYSIPPERGPVQAAGPGKKFSSPRIWVRNYGGQNGWTAEAHTRLLADVNGDGRADVVGFGGPGVFVSFSDGRRFSAPQLLLRSFGRDQGWSPSRTRFASDVDGDGRADIVAIEGMTARVAFSTGKGFKSPVSWPLRLNGETPGRRGPNDARFVHPGFVGKQAFIWDWRRNEINTWSPHQGQFLMTRMHSGRMVEDRGWTRANSRRFLGDVNGDGYVDAIGAKENTQNVGFGKMKFVEFFVALSTHPQSNVAPETLQFNDFASTIAGSHFTTGDVDGDGKSDLVLFRKGGVFVARSRLSPQARSSRPSKNSAFETLRLGIDAFGPKHGWSNRRHVRVLADVDGDGRDDVVGFSDGGVQVALSRW